MNAVSLRVLAGLAVVRRDALVFASYRGQAISQLFGSAVSVALFYYVSRLISAEQFGGPNEYFAFVVVGMTIVQLITATLGVIPVSVRGELVAGTLERMFLSPFGAVGGLLGMMVFPTLLSLLSAAMTIATGVVLFKLPVEIATLPLAIPLGALCALAFVPFSLLFAAIIVAFKQLPPGASYLVVALTFVSGLYFPVDLLPSWIAWAADVQPYTPAVDLLRYVISGIEPETSPWMLVARIIGFTVVLMPLSVFAVSRAIAHGRRTGSLIEY